jgi:hypothetical protein
MTITLHLRIVGLMLVALATMGLFLPRKFNWRAEARHLSPLNRQILYVHNAFIILLLLMFAGLALGCTNALLDPHPVARAVLGGMAFFWFLRLVIQWFVYDASLWRGKTFETAMHVLFTGVWIYFSGTFAWALWINLHGA